MGKDTLLEERIRVRLDAQGRLVIPAEIRRKLGLNPGEIATMWIAGDELRVLSVSAGIQRAQAIAAAHTRGRTGLVDEFLKERRADSGD
jgi:bifunctional DNA-binding transcriptional regulator/antitoxin component of YhaV-PrlF toxin-antitoxin module